MPFFYRNRRVAAPQRLQQPLQGPQVVGANCWAGPQLHPATGGPIEHPLRQFERPSRLILS